MDRLKSAIIDSVDQMRQAASRASGALPDTDDIQANATSVADAIRRNPLGLFFGMAAAGFLIGLLIPITAIEDEQLVPMMGQMRERAKGRVQETIAAARDAALSSINSAIGGTNA